MEAAVALMRSKAGGAFEFVSNFDANGVLWWLGTEGGTTAYANPHTAGRVVARFCSILHGNMPILVKPLPEAPRRSRFRLFLPFQGPLWA